MATRDSYALPLKRTTLNKGTVMPQARKFSNKRM